MHQRLGTTEKQIQLSGRVEDLNLGPPDFKSSTLNHLATPPPLHWLFYSSILCVMPQQFSCHGCFCFSSHIINNNNIINIVYFSDRHFVVADEFVHILLSRMRGPADDWYDSNRRCWRAVEVTCYV